MSNEPNFHNKAPASVSRVDANALRQAVPMRERNGRPYYVRMQDIPPPWQTEFDFALHGSACPLINGEGKCAYAWDWLDWLQGRLPHG
jgi:hypothetical protein